MLKVVLIFFTLVIGIATAGSWAYTFYLFLRGYQVYEPNPTIAGLEMALAGFLTLVTIVALVLFIRK